MQKEFSAGGIVYKKIKDPVELLKQFQGKQKSKIKNKSDILWLVCQHSQHKGWVFPKGLIGDHVKREGVKETAVREVKEETGVEAKIIAKLPKPATYFYVWQKEKRFKTVYYFLMKYVSGDTKNHDFEMCDVIWLSTDQVLDKLTYKSDKEAFREALEMFKTLPS